jgi:hypothetical protein
MMQKYQEEFDDIQKEYNQFIKQCKCQKSQQVQNRVQRESNNQIFAQLKNQSVLYFKYIIPKYIIALAEVTKDKTKIVDNDDIIVEVDILLSSRYDFIKHWILFNQLRFDFDELIREFPCIYCSGFNRLTCDVVFVFHSISVCKWEINALHSYLLLKSRQQQFQIKYLWYQDTRRIIISNYQWKSIHYWIALIPEEVLDEILLLVLDADAKVRRFDYHM